MRRTRITIVVTPDSKSRGIYIARLGGSSETLCTSDQPFLDGARVLLERGFPPDAILTMRHEGNDTIALRGRLDIAARLTIEERSNGSRPPTFVKWKPRQMTERSGRTAAA